MSAKKKIAKKGPGRGGFRPGAGRKPSGHARSALLAVRVTPAAKERVEATAEAQGITPAALVQGWAETL